MTKHQMDEAIVAKNEACPGCGRRDQHPCEKCQECSRCCRCALTVQCPRCFAPAGTPCDTKRVHLDRVRAAAGHVMARFRRHHLGHHPVNGHSLYGWTARCSCGWEKRTNEGKREAEGFWRDHADAAPPFSEAMRDLAKKGVTP